MAYHSSPHLAFQLANRFKNLDAVSKEVVRLVHSNPVAFVDIPDAAQVCVCVCVDIKFVLAFMVTLYYLMMTVFFASTGGLIFLQISPKT